MAIESLSKTEPGAGRWAAVRASTRADKLERWAVPVGVLLYVIWATNITWPLMRDPGGAVLGGIGDQTGGIALMREWVHDGLFPFLPGTVQDFSAPEGLAMNWGINLGNWPYLLPAWLLSIVIGPVAAFSLITWLGLVLNGVTMQILATRLTGSRLGGLVAGFAFAFSPFAVINAGGHPQFAHWWPLTLMAWRMLEVARAPTRRNAAWAALTAILAVGFTSYYILIGGVLLATCMALALVYGWRTRTLRRQIILQVAVGIAVLIYIGVLAALALGAGGGGLRSHSESELYQYGARVHDYFVPFGRNILFGQDTAPWLQAHEHGSNFTESTLYLGLVVLQLGFIALVAAFARWSSPRLRWAVLIGLAVALVGFVWSAPPKVGAGGVLWPTPSSVVSDISSTWRVYSRFGIVVILGTSLMAAAGVAALTAGRRPLAALAVAAVAIAGVAIDFTWRPGVTPLGDPPPVYRLVRDRPGGILAQYPLLPAGYGDSSDLLWQDAAGHPLLTGYQQDGRNDRRALTMYFVDRLKTARGLASLGVRYVLVPDTPVAGTPDPGRPKAGFRRIGSDRFGAGTATVYEVTTKPDLGYVYLQAGGSFFDEGDAKDPLSWISEPKGTLSVDAPRCKAPCVGHLRVRLLGLGARKHQVTLRAHEKVIWEGSVAASRTIDVPLTVAGRQLIEIAATPGPTPVSRLVPGSNDPRAIMIGVSRMRFIR
jgi:hypothetical protein